MSILDLLRPVTPYDRFMAKTARDPETGCLVWQNCKNDKEYGQFSYRGKLWRASRWIFWYTHGYLPKVVMHTCDNPPCVEITHLKPGTQSENMLDMYSKGRR